MSNLPDINHVIDIVRKTAQQNLVPHFGQISRNYKADKSIVTEVDLANQAALQQKLREHWPELDLLGEEMTAAEQETRMASHSQGLWIVDPLDGTSNFTAGIPYFAVSVALYIEGQIRLGVVYDPNRDEAFAATDTTETTLNGKPLQRASTPVKLSQTIGVIDFKRLSPELATRIATQQPFASQRSFGSVALDWCWLASNRFHIYLHGCSNIWDYAAGELIFRRAGGNSCTLEGEPVFQASVTPRSAVGALDQKHFESWTDFLGVKISR